MWDLFLPDSTAGFAAFVQTHQSGTQSNPKNQMQTQIELNHDEVARRAYDIWQAAGCPQGCDKEHWQQAEAELRAAFQGRLKPAASTASPGATPAPAAKAAEPSRVAPVLPTARPKLGRKSRVTRVRATYAG